MKRLLAVLALVVTTLVIGQGTALAHDTLLNTDPADGARMSAGPREVRLSFNEPVRPGYDTVTVVGPGGTYWTDAPPRIAGSTVVEPVHELGPAGAYVVSYRVLSNDGHPVEGKVTFDLTKPGTGTPVPAPNGTVAATSQANAGGMPIWPWLVGAVVLVAVGLLLALRLGRPSDKR
jgi:methionine-rich copper-binding protein CopC